MFTRCQVRRFLCGRCVSGSDSCHCRGRLESRGRHDSFRGFGVVARAVCHHLKSDLEPVHNMYNMYWKENREHVRRLAEKALAEVSVLMMRWWKCWNAKNSRSRPHTVAIEQMMPEVLEETGSTRGVLDSGQAVDLVSHMVSMRVVRCGVSFCNETFQSVDSFESRVSRMRCRVNPGRHCLSCTCFIRTEKSQWRAQCKPKRRIQRTQTEEAHQPTGKENERYEFEEIRYKTITVENCKNIIAGMNGDLDEVLNMTVHVRTFNGKTISIKCGRRQEAKKIKAEVERKTKSPKEQQHLVCQGIALKEGTTIRDCNIKQYTTIEMILKIAWWNEE